MKAELREYQKKAVEWFKRLRRCGLFIQMGLGKTRSVLHAVAEMPPMATLVVAPKLVSEHVWTGEVAKWGYPLTVSVIAGDQRRRVAAFERKADIHCVGVANLVWLVKLVMDRKMKWPYKRVVIDESSLFKDSSTVRWKAMKSISKTCEEIVLLTGTPGENLLNLWAQIYLIDGGARLGRSFTAYRNKYFESDYMGWRWTPRAGAEQAIHEAIQDICLSMKAEDWLELPELVSVTVPVAMSAEARRIYEKMERDFIVEALDEAEGDIVAVNAAVLTGKLLQLTSGFAYDEFGKAKRYWDGKLDALEEIVEANERVLIAYQFKEDFVRLKERFPDIRDIREEGVIERWSARDPAVRRVALHPKSAGHGLNLQSGGSVVVWFSLTYSLESYQQLNARLHRQGQQEAVIVHHLIAEGSIDEEVLGALGAKAGIQERLMQALKARAERWESIKG